MDKPIIAVDIDGVYFETHQQGMIASLNERFSTDYKFEDVDDFEYGCFDSREKAFMFELWHKMDYNTLTAEPGAETVCETLREWYDILAVSSPMTGLHVKTKYDRLKNDFGYKNVILTSRKDLINADVLIDDAPHNIVEWLQTDRPIIIFRRPWNKQIISEVYQDRLVRVVDHWAQIPDKIEEALGELAWQRSLEAEAEDASALHEEDMWVLSQRGLLSDPASKQDVEL